ncbi:methyl-accepting chemotaxis protein [Bacillus sp. FJAT-50079]|uniref:methyl-accepting chemotaxis protein n=1 Tax=Bacillus sp. FJAT-50079 TaxID=2833577 RepID=UPI001BC92DA4|nr:methyl-accepting chemotaxis protein [Bacillus sp. FJAT-50079]MBS4206907.1 methyl-accepting chemotaxis protein [Bacillus sp. FJAT-50079]
MKSLKAKILRGFLILNALVLVMGAVSFVSNKLSNNQTEKVIEEELPLLMIYQEIHLNISEMTSLARGYILYGQNGYLNSFNFYAEESRRLESELLSLSNTEQTEEAISKIHAWEDMIKEQVFDTYNEGNRDLARMNFRTNVEIVGQQLMTTFKQLSDDHAKNIKDNGEKVIEAGIQATTLNLILTSATILLGLIIAFYMANSLSRPIVRVANRMKLIADGDLTHEDLKTRSKDEVGVLIHSVNEMNRQIRAMAVDIGTVSETVKSRSAELSQSAFEVNSGSQQVAITMEELANASETQAQSASDLVESMGRLAANIHDANEQGHLANAVTDEVLNLTTKGNEAMVESISVMKVIDENVKDAVRKVSSLDEHSKQISHLIKVISEIAEQTNLLALNAAIEAARAGEHGKGFAVVAGEVKKLAEQVANSISDITGIVSTIQRETKDVVGSLQDSFQQVEIGTKQIESTGHAFESISHSVQEVVQQIQKITADLREIDGSADTMNAAISNIAAITEEASAGIEETAASTEQSTSSMQEIAANAESLSAVALNLNQLIQKFKVN